jgi:uncharacterized protein HemX
VSPEERPELRAISDEEPPESPEPAVIAPADPVSGAQDEPRHKRGSRWLTLLLLLALVVACLGYVYEQRRAQGFETQVTALQTELTALTTDLQDARRELRAHEERMQVVRGHVDDLAGRVELIRKAIAVDAE